MAKEKKIWVPASIHTYVRPQESGRGAGQAPAHCPSDPVGLLGAPSESVTRYPPLTCHCTGRLIQMWLWGHSGGRAYFDLVGGGAMPREGWEELRAQGSHHSTECLRQPRWEGQGPLHSNIKKNPRTPWGRGGCGAKNVLRQVLEEEIEMHRSVRKCPTSQ